MPRGVKSTEMLNEAVEVIIDLAEEDLSVCHLILNRYDGQDWCPKDCPRIIDDGCVLHLLRMRIKQKSKESE